MFIRLLNITLTLILIGSVSAFESIETEDVVSPEDKSGSENNSFGENGIVSNEEEKERELEDKLNSSHASINVSVTAPQEISFCEPYIIENSVEQPIEIINMTYAMKLIAAHRKGISLSPATSTDPNSNINNEPIGQEGTSNSTDFLSLIGLKSPSRSQPRGRCIAIYLFAHWCGFSAAAAPYISALAKLFSSCCMRFVAVDAANDVSGTTTFFGAGSVPQLIIYRPHRPVVRISPIRSDLPLLVELVNNATGFNVTIPSVTDFPDYEDYHDNVLPLTPVKDFDIYLVAAWIHTILTLIIIAFKFDYVRNLVVSTWNYLRGFGQEIHAHLD